MEMRDVSMPAWAVLREPSTSSPGAEDDEQRSRASADMVDEIDATPAPATQPLSRRKKNPTGAPALPPGATQPAGSRTGDARSQVSRAAAARRAQSPAGTRRPLSGNEDDEDALRPRKRKRRKIVDPDKALADAATHLSRIRRLPPVDTSPAVPSASRGGPLRAAASAQMREARRQRRVTLDNGAMAAQSLTQAGSQPAADKRPDRRFSAAGALPGSSSATPLQRAQARRKATNPGGGAAGPSKSATASSSQRPTSGVPHEVIEILDSDDEQPQPPKAHTPAPAPPPTQKKRPDIPRRTKQKPAPAPTYKEDADGVIILDFDEDEATAPSKPSKPPSKPLTSSGPPPDASQARKSSPRRSSEAAPAPISTNTSTVPAPPHQPDPTESELTPPTEPPDVEMAAEDPMNTIGGEPPDEHMDDQLKADEPMGNAADGPNPQSPIPPEAAPTIEEHPSSAKLHGIPQPVSDTRDSPTPAPITADDVPAEDERGPARDDLYKAVSPVDAEPAGEEISNDDIPTHETDAMPAPDAANTRLQRKTVLDSDLAKLAAISQTQAVVSTLLPLGDMRSDTASPVSAVLDAPLRGLSIAEPSTGDPSSGLSSGLSSGQQASSGPSSGQQPPSTTPSGMAPLTNMTGIASKFTPTPSCPASPPSASTPPPRHTQTRPNLSKVRIRGSLFGGPNGFFADVHRLSQQHAASQASSPARSVSAAKDCNSNSISPRASASLSPSARTIERVDSLPVLLQEPEPELQDEPERAGSSQPEAALEQPKSSMVSTFTEVPAAVPQCVSAVGISPSSAREEQPAVGPERNTPEANCALKARIRSFREIYEEVTASSSQRFIEQGGTSESAQVEDSPATTSSISAQAPGSTSLVAHAVSAPALPSSSSDTQEASTTPPPLDTPVDAPVRETEPTRHGTPPAEDTPEARTLSQVIQQAVNEQTRANADNEQPVVIDLTFDDSDGDVPRATLTVPASQPTAGPPPSPTTTSAPPPATPAASQLVKTLDLTAMSIRKSSRSMPQLSPSKPAGKPPLPRNLRRGVAPFPTMPAQSSAGGALPAATPLPAQANPSESSKALSGSTPLAPPASAPGPSIPRMKPMLPRPRDLMRAQLARSQAPTPQTTSPQLANATPPGLPSTAASQAEDPEPPTVIFISSSPPSIPPSPADDRESGALDEPAEGRSGSSPAGEAAVLLGATPPRSSSPEALEEEEEECISLIYPGSSEVSPDPEMAPEEEGAPGHEEGQGEEVFIPALPRTRGHVGSGASSVASGPRPSARLTSSSESSSVEPPDRPLTRLRRREPYIRNVSEDAVLVNGGITRRTADQQYVRAFAQAGFEAISWKHDRRRIAKEFAPLTQLARDIPHDLHDRLNALSLGARRAGNMQVLVFEAEIRANTAEDEPGAPPIRVVNDVDDEPTPPLEFYYSNLMWHGEGVPGPDHENLQGCDCVGPCDPTSRTCACVRRQQKWWPGGPAGFIYDKKGRLRELGYPIFECNMNCGCSDDCQNRVVQNGRQHEIAICKTPNKGWGVFAGPKKIPANSYLGTYAGEFLTSWECEERGKVYNKFGRTYLFDLDFWYLDQPEVKKEDYSVDAYHAGNFTRYLNHSCDPNCVINACYINEANLDKPLLTIFTCRDVEPFEELCFSYFGEPDDDAGVEVPKEVKDNDAVYVSCQCGAANCRGTMWK